MSFTHFNQHRNISTFKPFQHPYSNMFLFSVVILYQTERKNKHPPTPNPTHPHPPAFPKDSHWFQTYLWQKIFLNLCYLKLKEIQEKIQAIFILDSGAPLHYSCRLTAVRFFDIREDENFGVEKASSECLPSLRKQRNI